MNPEIEYSMSDDPAHNDLIHLKFTPAELSYLIYICEQMKHFKTGCKECDKNKNYNKDIHLYLIQCLDCWRTNKKEIF